MRLPGFELGAVSTTLCLILLDLVERLLLIRGQHRSDIGLGFRVFGGQFILHGFLIGWRKLGQVLMGDFGTTTPLIAHQFADLLTLFRSQVQLVERAFAVMHARTVKARTARTTHVAAFGRCSHRNSRQGSSEHQSHQSLTHGVSPCLESGSVPVVASLGRSRSSEVRRA